MSSLDEPETNATVDSVHNFEVATYSTSSATTTAWHDVVVNLRRQSNAHLPVSRLPVEILVETFKLCQGKSKKGFMWREDWIALTHVCHHWRTVALATPALWSTVKVDENMTSCVALRTWLSRSAETTLQKSRHRRDSVDAAMLDPILEVLHRTRQFSVRITSDQHIASLQRFIKSPNVTLKDLKLLCIVDMEILPVPLDKHFPVLEKLAISSEGLEMRSWILPSSLLKLKLSFICITPLEFMHCLRQLPLLEQLSTEYLKVTADTDAATTTAQTTLPSLVSLHIDGPLEDMFLYLERIKLPSTARVELYTRAFENLSAYPDILRVISTWGLGSEEPFESVHTSLVPTSHDFCVRAWRHLRPVKALNHRDSQSEVDLCIAVLSEDPEDSDGEWQLDEDEQQECIEEILRGLPLSNVRSLSLDYVDSDVLTLPRAFGNMRAVDTLGIFGRSTSPAHSVKNVLELLDPHGSATVDDFTFPSLRRLVLHYMNFDSAFSLAQFHRIVNRYSQNGGAPIKIVLQKCSGMTAQHVSALKKVAVVKWDGPQRDPKGAPTKRAQCATVAQPSNQLGL